MKPKILSVQQQQNLARAGLRLNKDMTFEGADNEWDAADIPAYIKRMGFNTSTEGKYIPVYAHDCDACTWMGTYGVEDRKFDFYHCNHESLIARCGDEPHEYASCALQVMIARSDPWLGLPELWWAYIRYLQDFFRP